MPIRRNRAGLGYLAATETSAHRCGREPGLFFLPWTLWRLQRLSLIHTHTLGRLAGIALQVARAKNIPFVVTIHGGALNLPEDVLEEILKPLKGGLEWGKALGAIVGSRQVLARADAVLTCNAAETALLREKYRSQRIVTQPHGVETHLYEVNHIAEAEAAYPALCGKRVLLVLGRIDPIKNQRWLLDQMPEAFRIHSKAVLVFAGSFIDKPYAEALRQRIDTLGLQNRVFLTGGFPPDDPCLIGLLQKAEVLIVPSRSETFGLVILEAWAAGTPVLASRTSGACELVEEGKTGLLFGINDEAGFLKALGEILFNPSLQSALTHAGRRHVLTHYDQATVVQSIKSLYEKLIEERQCR